MKHIFFLSAAFWGYFQICLPQDIVDVVSYDMSNEQPFVYSHTFPSITNLAFNLPFASSFSIIGGNHLEFTIDYDSFYFHLIRKTGVRENEIGHNYAEQYVDFVLVDTYDTSFGTSCTDLVYVVEADVRNGYVRAYYTVNWDASFAGNHGATTLAGTCSEHILRVHYYK